MLHSGHSGDGCDLSSTLCKYDLRKCDLFSELGKGATNEAGKYLFRAANVWCRCAQYLLLPLMARCLETIDVCIWRRCVFMSVVAIVWGSVGMFVV